MWCLPIFSFCYGFPLKEMRANNRFREGSRRVIKISDVSLTPRDSIPRSHWHRGIRSRGLIETAESELCKRLSRFSLRIRSYMRNSLSPWIRALGGIVWFKKPRVENLVNPFKKLRHWWVPVINLDISSLNIMWILAALNQLWLIEMVSSRLCTWWYQP
jgi:hypothetical protein